MKMKITLIGFLLLLLSACELGSQMRPPMPTDFSVNVADSDKCGCPGAKLVSVTAKQGSPRFSVAKLERDMYGPDIARSKTTNYQINTPNTQALGCTIDRPVAQPEKCSLVRTFDVNGAMYPNDLADLSRARVLSIVAGRLDETGGGSGGTGMCATRCKAGTDGCPTYDATKSGDVALGPKIAQFAGSIKADETVGIGRIMALTSGGQNNCGRTDLVGMGGLFSNAGSRCDISSSMGAMGQVRITIPEALQFKLATPQVNRFTVIFEKSAGAPRLEVTGGTTPVAYNGPVNRVDYMDGLYAVEVNNKCLGILTKSGV